MNHLRTNETKRVGDLISSALLNAIDQNYTPPKSKNTFKIKVEGGDPVRSAARVPQSSSHHLFSFGSAQDDTFSGTASFDGVYAERSRSTQDDKVAKSEEINVAAA